MCLGLNGFVVSLLPSAAAAMASAPKRLRIRATAYPPIATTTTRSSTIHTLLNSRNNLCLLTCRSSRHTERRRPHAAPRSRPGERATTTTELKFYVRRLLHLIARPEVGWRVHGRAHPKHFDACLRRDGHNGFRHAHSCRAASSQPATTRSTPHGEESACGPQSSNLSASPADG